MDFFYFCLGLIRLAKIKKGEEKGEEEKEGEAEGVEEDGEEVNLSPPT